MKITATQTFLHPVELYPDDPSDTQSYALRYEEGKSYEVDDAQAQLFRTHGWAESADDGADTDEPFDTRNATDEMAEKLEREVHAPARETTSVQTVRFVGTGTNEVVGTGEQDPYEGENVRVVDLGQGESSDADGDTLDVHDADSDQGAAL